MPVPAGGTIDPEATRRRILERAEEVFAERGVTAVGLNELAEVAGASKASIYKNFGSKEGLAAAALEDRSRRTQAWLRRETAARPAGRERVLAVFDLMLEWYAEDGYRGCAIVNAAAEARVAEGPTTQVARRHLAAYRNFLLGELTAAGAREAGFLTTQLLVLIEGATIVSAIDGDPSAGAAARQTAERLLA